MAIKLTTTRQAAQINGLKFLVYGAAGAGKTRLAATLPGRTVIISAEAGLLSLRDTDIPVITIASMADLSEAYTYLTTTEDGRGFESVALDSISEVAEVCLNTEKALSKDPRQAYGALQDQMLATLRAFRDLEGRNVYMSAKMERTKDEVTGVMLYAPAMPGSKLGQAIPYLFDEVFVLHAEKQFGEQKIRCLQTVADISYAAKDRSGGLEAFEPPSLGEIAKKILSGKPATAAGASVSA
jgi:phage nucleotide-binding protein